MPQNWSHKIVFSPRQTTIWVALNWSPRPTQNKCKIRKKIIISSEIEISCGHNIVGQERENRQWVEERGNNISRIHDPLNQSGISSSSSQFAHIELVVATTPTTSTYYCVWHLFSFPLCVNLHVCFRSDAVFELYIRRYDTTKLYHHTETHIETYETPTDTWVKRTRYIPHIRLFIVCIYVPRFEWQARERWMESYNVELTIKYATTAVYSSEIENACKWSRVCHRAKN